MLSITRSTIVLSALLASCGRDHAPSDGAGSDRGPRNVVLFVVDTLRADRLEPYGYPRPITPNTAALAERGTLWENNRSQGPWTAPSMVSMMSGLYVTDEEQNLPGEYPTLAELVQEAGYATGAFIGNRILTTQRGFERGFDHFEFVNGDDADQLVGRFESWVAGLESDDSGRPEPFFAWLHPIDPHTPYQKRKGYGALVGPRPDQDEVERRWRREQQRVGTLSPDKGWSYDRARAFMLDENARYDSEVLAVDRALGRLIDELQRLGILDQTTIAFAADHGEMLYEYRHYPLELKARLRNEQGLERGVAGLMASGHRAWFYPELWNTPLILAGPGFPEGERRQGLSGNIDLFPTILGLLGVEFDDQRPGVDLRGGVEPDRELIFAHGFVTDAVLERGGLQLIRHDPRRFSLSPTGPREIQLLDLSGGGELRDVKRSRPRDTERLLGAVEDWSAEHQRRATLAEVTPEAEAALRELGYLED